MSGHLTQWGASQLILACFSRAIPPPPKFYLALIKDVAPSLYVSGAEIDEPEAADYGRVEIPNDAMNWSNSSQPQVAVNVMDVMYVAASTDWGICNYWALCNSPVEGMNYFVGDLDVPVNVTTGDTPMIGAGDLSVSLGPFFMVEVG